MKTKYNLEKLQKAIDKLETAWKYINMDVYYPKYEACNRLLNKLQNN